MRSKKINIILYNNLNSVLWIFLFISLPSIFPSTDGIDIWFHLSCQWYHPMYLSSCYSIPLYICPDIQLILSIGQRLLQFSLVHCSSTDGWVHVFHFTWLSSTSALFLIRAHSSIRNSLQGCRFIQPGGE